jgi:7-keto-8-aminopelargonate synthetase-like enzyme
MQDSSSELVSNESWLLGGGGEGIVTKLVKHKIIYLQTLSKAQGAYGPPRASEDPRKAE